MDRRADDLLAAGDLAGARAALVETVKAKPDDAAARMFLFQVQCVSGDWDRALTQLRALGSLQPEAQMLATVYSQTITAERVRADAFAGRADTPVLVSTSPWVDDVAKAMRAFGEGRDAEAEDLRGRAFDAAGETPGAVDGAKFAWIADADPRFGPTFEAIVAGRWGLVPFEAVSWIKIDGPESLRDLVWLPVEMGLRSGQSIAGFLPARYPGTETEADDLRLGRRTEWRDGPGGQIGLGRRLLTTDSGDDLDLLSVRRVDMV